MRSFLMPPKRRQREAHSVPGAIDIWFEPHGIPERGDRQLVVPFPVTDVPEIEQHNRIVRLDFQCRLEVLDGQGLATQRSIQEPQRAGGPNVRRVQSERFAQFIRSPLVLFEHREQTRTLDVPPWFDFHRQPY
jgi:hypothetical protein